MINSLSALESLHIGLNISEIPTNAIVPSSGNKSLINDIAISSKYHNLTVKTGAFQQQELLGNFEFRYAKIDHFEREAFKNGFNSNNYAYYFRIQLTEC